MLGIIIGVALTPLDTEGVVAAPARTVTLDAQEMVSSFIDELIPALSSPFEGTVLVEVSSPVYAISIRGTTDPTNGFLMTALPVFDFTRIGTETTYGHSLFREEIS